jgi:hypothetical protein
MNKIDQVFDQIHKHVCDKNAQILDPKEKKKTFYLDTMSWRSAKSIEDIRKNILLQASTLGIVGTNISGSIADFTQTITCLGVAFYPNIRDKIPNERKIRELYTGIILLMVFSESIFILADHNLRSQISSTLTLIINIYILHWANSSDQPKKRKRRLQDDTLRQRLLDLMNPPPITIKTSEV